MPSIVFAFVDVSAREWNATTCRLVPFQAISKQIFLIRKNKLCFLADIKVEVLNRRHFSLSAVSYPPRARAMTDMKSRYLSTMYSNFHNRPLTKAPTFPIVSNWKA